MTAVEDVRIVEGVVARPGDTVLIAWPRGTLSATQADGIVEHLKARLPHLQFVVVPANQLLVCRPDS